LLLYESRRDTRLTSRRVSCIILSYHISTRIMYEDYEFNTFDLDYTYDLDETYAYNHNAYNHNETTYELDDDNYQRDSTDYQALAYMHYA